MSNKMLVDAIHPEETRVVVVRDKKVEDFDFEAASRKPLRGNIYLAKVIRVEASLQAAFVDYGGNRHGFLAFSEIHPDYYQIPQADRAALLEYEREQAEEEDEEQPKPRRSRSRRSSRSRSKETATADADTDDSSDAAADESAAAVLVEADDTDTADDGASAAMDDVSDDGGDANAPEEGEAGAPEDGGGDEPALSADDNADETPANPDDAGDVAEAPAATALADDGAGADGTPPLPSVAESDDQDGAVAEGAADATPETPEAVASPVAETDASATAADGAPQEEGAPAADASAADAEAAGEDKPKPKRRRRTTTKSTTKKTTTAKSKTTKKSDDGLEQPLLAEREPGEHDEADEDGGADGEGDLDAEGSVTAVGNSDALEEIPERRRRPQRRHYKIQDVIKRRQILLVQVVKEERGTKGAALTTYLSLAGRYSVLMPNTDRGGGVSRKITDNADRKRLKSLVAELDVPDGMGIILRTAGAARTKTEIKRDFEYLIRLWESVRELTLKSIAPQLVYEEGSLVKRAIRDIYSKEIDEVLVSGDAAYREAKDFMKMLTPSHAKNVKPYREATPIFTAYQIEPQLDAMFSPQVTLPSKGYIVINSTEALVAIDVNSGRSTKESNIEDTALKTNLEAADEVARQLRLRDLAGLIVIDFIDMDEKRHNRAVEKRLKDALKLDRSRIQVGRISPFGLLEMSRQRIRQGMVETSQVSCPTCNGTGLVRSTSSVALFCLRSLEEHLLKSSNNHVTLRTTSAVALYILNQKRSHLRELEARFQLEISVDADETMAGNLMDILTGAPVERSPGNEVPTTQLSPDAIVVEESVDDDEVRSSAATDTDDESGSGRSRRRRRRRRRGGGSDMDGRGPQPSEEQDDSEKGNEATATAEDDENVDAALAGEADTTAQDDESGEDGPRRRRRGRRGGRRHRRDGDASDVADAATTDAAGEDSDGAAENAAAEDAPATEPIAIAIQDGAPDTPEADALTTEPAGTDEVSDEPDGQAGEPDGDEASAEAADLESADSENTGTEAAEASDEGSTTATTEEARGGAAAQTESAPERKSEGRPRRVGWWQRRSFF